MRLVLVELSRFRARRAIALMVLAAALLTALLAATTLWDSRPVSAAEVAHARAEARQQAASPEFRRQLQACKKDPESYSGPGATAADCAANMTPRAEWFIPRQPLSLGNVNEDTGVGILLLLTAIMVIVGTTFAGADWSSGSMSNQLLFEPRRTKVWLAKAAAVLVGTLAVSALLVAGFWVAVSLTADAWGVTTSAAARRDILGTAGRGVLLAGFGALGAYGLTMLLRHTVGTLATLFAYAIGGTAVLAAIPVAGVGRWSVGNNVFAWLMNGYQYHDASLPCTAGGVCDQTVTMSLAQGSAYLAVVLAVVLLASAFSFRRRDVP